jgi:hypothetical protein
MQRTVPILILLLLALTALAADKTIDQLKAEAEKADSGQQARLYAEVAERLVEVADQQFTSGNAINGHATIQEVLQYAIKARDRAISTRKKMKETEIHLRNTQRRLESLKRTLAAEDRPALEDVEKKLAQFRQEILDAMFAPKPKKENK